MAKSDAADRVAALKYLITHPDAFIEYYSGLRLKPFQRRILYAVHTSRRIVVLLPAGHGKSTLIAKWYTIFLVCQNPNIRIILVMKTDAEVKHYARSIKRELTQNKKLIADWGPFIPVGKDIVWSNEAIEVRKRQITDPQPTVEFASAKSIEQVLGHRCDVYIADDIVTPTTVSTADQRQKQKELFNQGLDTCPQYLWDVDKNGRFINKPEHIYWPDSKDFPEGLCPVYEKGVLIGTVFHPQDLFHEKGRSPIGLKPGRLYRGNDPKWRFLYYDCWEHDENNDTTDTPLWPERWTAEALKEQERSLGTADFNKRYRNIAVDESDLTFRRAWVLGDPPEYPGCLDERRSFGEYPHEGRWFTVLGFDPSTGRKAKGSTWSSYVVTAIDMDEKAPATRYIIDIYRNQLGFDDILDKLYELYWKYNCSLAIVEQNAAQRWLLDNHRVKSWIADERMNIRGYETQVGNKLDPVMGVGSMQSIIKDGKLRIPYKEPSDRDKASPFIEQLCLFPEGLTDWVMALWFTNIAIGDTAKRYRSWSRSGEGRTYTLSSR